MSEENRSGNENEGVNNVLVRGERSKEETPATLYDASAEIRFPYTVTQNGEKYSVIYIFKPLTDERYMQWNRDLKVTGTADEIEESSREATCELWDDLIIRIEGAEYDEDANWKTFIDPGEKVEAINDLLAVAIVDDTPTATGKLQLGKRPETQKVVTEAYFMDRQVVTQTHTLANPNLELRKRFDRIKSKTIKQEKTRGLRRAAKVEYVPQDEKFGELYDEMLEQVEGIRLGNDYLKAVPLRFKNAVINYIFAPKLDPKTVGK